MNDASTNPPPSRGVSMTTLILAVALAATTTAAVVLAVLYLTSGGRPAVPGAPGQSSLFSVLTGSGPTPFIQKETVKPQGHTSGDVVYPLPFAAPPHLTLSAPRRVYTITKQSEKGFSWTADDMADDFVGDLSAIQSALRDHNVINAVFAGQFNRKPEIVYEDFTWEAKGLPPGADTDSPVELTGTFQSVLGKDGQEYFATPFSSIPQITLSGHNGTTIVQEATPTGFKWKNAGTDNPFPGNNAGEVTWTAKGLRAPKPPK